MQILGLVNVALFVLLLVKCGFGRGFKFLLGNVFVVGLIEIAAFVVVFIFTHNGQWARWASGAAGVVMTLVRMKAAVDDIRK